MSIELDDMQKLSKFNQRIGNNVPFRYSGFSANSCALFHLNEKQQQPVDKL